MGKADDNFALEASTIANFPCGHWGGLLGHTAYERESALAVLYGHPCSAE